MPIKYPKLPKRFKAKWLKALRSGEYKQGQKRLYQQDQKTFCCLGVAGKICDIPLQSLRFKGFLIGKNIKNKVPDLIYGNCDADESIIISKLVTMNDNGKSFKIIANWIEKHL